jgi:hypothetical protein
MANFPNSPTLNQTHLDTTSGFIFQWDGTVWRSYTPESLVLNVEARTETVAVPISVGYLVLDVLTVGAQGAQGPAGTTGSTGAQGVQGPAGTSSQINDLDLALFD